MSRPFNSKAVVDRCDECHVLGNCTRYIDFEADPETGYVDTLTLCYECDRDRWQDGITPREGKRELC